MRVISENDIKIIEEFIEETGIKKGQGVEHILDSFLIKYKTSQRGYKNGNVKSRVR